MDANLYRKAWALAGLAIVLAVVSWFGTRYVYAQTRRTPLTYNLTETMLTPSGTVGRTHQYFYGVRSDGSTVEVRRSAAPDGTPVEQRIIEDLSGLRRISVDGLTESVTTYSISARAAASKAAKPESCTSAAPAAHSTLLGYDVVRDAQELPAPAPGAKHRVESWRAPALNCLALDERLFRTDNGHEILVTVRQVTSINQQEPDPQLFTPPKGFIERSPGDVLAEFARRYPSAPAPNLNSFGTQQQNAAYAANHAE
jgi:hypothetical protein